MANYPKPEIIAKNLPSGSYAAGCPSHGNGSTCFYFNDMKGGCKKCERTK